MAKKKKAAANPARGFATTSIAAKPRPETTAETPASQTTAPPSSKDAAAPPKTTATTEEGSTPQNNEAEKKPLSPEEFEKQLEESELQLLVEKHAQKIKRDAQRQRTRLETDRRLLRANADSINSIKWLPDDLVNYILDLVKAENRFAASGASHESSGSGKMPPEEDLITRVWTLQLSLTGAGFPDNRVQAVVKHIVDIAPNISSTGKDSIWGLEEALEWLARECDPSELPAYEPKPKPVVKGLLFPLSMPYRSASLTFVPYQNHQAIHQARLGPTPHARTNFKATDGPRAELKAELRAKPLLPRRYL